MEKLLVRFSQLITELKWIKEVDINPLLASPEKLIALDARVVLFDKNTPEDKLPKIAIRPYPTQYISKYKLKAGTDVTIRPIRPEDEPALTKFHEKLSERTVKLRYFAPMKLSARVAHERLVRVCHNDFDREMALVAETKQGEIIGVGRLSKTPGLNEAEFAVLVSDQYQQQGLGTEFLSQLIKVGKAEKLEKISAEMMSENSEMQKVCRKLNFTITQGKDINDPVHAEMKF
jgi:acetyltransferase